MLPQGVTILVDGVTLVGEMYFAAGGDAAPVVVLCHGMPLGPPDPSDPGYPFLAQSLTRQGFSALIFNFRGTGPSEGNLDLAGWVQDLRAVLDFLNVAHDGPRPILMGFSAGAAVACRVASEDGRVGAVALLACPANFERLRQPENTQTMLEHCRKVGTLRDPSFPPSVSGWVEGFVKVDPVGCVKRVNPRPLLIVHGEDDDVVPVADAHRLYAAAGEPSDLVVLPGVGHHLRREEKAMAVVLDWLRGLGA
jgi:alpha/beta superfamily hydrolase